METYQLDRFPITNFDYSPSGILRVKGAIARTGAMSYLNKDGSVYWQYVPPETLFDLDHLDSIGGVPLTLGHPPEPVTPENYTKYAVGATGNKIFAVQDKGIVEVIFSVGDKKAIDSITSGEAKELSMGYQAILEPMEKDGWYIQKKRIADHVAAVNHARGGSDLKFYIDNKDCMYLEDYEQVAFEAYSELPNNKKSSWKIISYVG